MKRIAVLCWVGILSFSYLGAQSRKAWGGVGWFSGGYTILTGHEALREAVQAKGLSISSSLPGFLIGGGGGAYLGRLFIGGHGEAIVGGEVSGGYGFFRMGYFWRLGSRFIVLPTLGIGGGGYTFVLSNRPDRIGFSQAIEPSGGVPPRSLSTGGAKGNLNIALQYINKGFMAGLEVGYGQSLGAFQEWETAGISLQNGPKINPQQLYIRLLVGGGGLVSEGEK
ncbi:MAG: hypothetical protein ABDH66_02370 [Bacteroidia bacterium]